MSEQIVFKLPERFLTACLLGQIDDNVYLVFDGNEVFLSGKDSHKYKLDGITQSDLIKTFFEQSGIEVFIT